MAKLLIIDDDKEVCAYFKDFFARRGCQVVTSLSGEDGLVNFEEHNPNLVILDIKLPGIDGFEVLKQIKDKNRDAYVVMFSFAADEATREKAQALGANGFIRKPFNMAEVEAVVSVMLSKAII